MISKEETDFRRSRSDACFTIRPVTSVDCAVVVAKRSRQLRSSRLQGTFADRENLELSASCYLRVDPSPSRDTERRSLPQEERADRSCHQQRQRAGLRDWRSGFEEVVV